MYLIRWGASFNVHFEAQRCHAQKQLHDLFHSVPSYTRTIRHHLSCLSALIVGEIVSLHRATTLSASIVSSPSRFRHVKRRQHNPLRHALHTTILNHLSAQEIFQLHRRYDDVTRSRPVMPLLQCPCPLKVFLACPRILFPIDLAVSHQAVSFTALPETSLQSFE
jgi:hypothetical protein